MNLVNRPKILIVCDYYLPGFVSGGGLRSIVNLVGRLGDRFDFWIITRDHDSDGKTYKNVFQNEWNTLGNAQVLYLTRDGIKLSKIRELIFNVKPDSIYINSVFSRLSIFVLLLKKLKFIRNINLILAPEGELSKGALQLKAKKKHVFLTLAKKIGLYNEIIWKTTSDLEKKEVEVLVGYKGKIFIAPNMPPRHYLENYQQEMKPQKKVGFARLVFVSRYMQKKNFKWLLENLQGIEGDLEIDIYGPLEDEIYWKKSLQIIEKLPANIQIKYQGVLTYDKVVTTLFEYQFFILPTLGENFGHVFLEALAAGCPLIISDRTPWLNLTEKQIGWDIPLESPNKWVETINQCIKLNDMQYQEMSSKARSFSNEWLMNPEVEEGNIKVLEFSVKPN